MSFQERSPIQQSAEAWTGAAADPERPNPISQDDETERQECASFLNLIKHLRNQQNYQRNLETQRRNDHLFRWEVKDRIEFPQ
jgi:hypothetical protein